MDDQFYLLSVSPDEDTTDWLHVIKHKSGQIGYVPTSYMDQRIYDDPDQWSNSTDPKTLTKNTKLNQSNNQKLVVQKPIKQTNKTGRNNRPYKLPAPGSSPYKRLTGVIRDTDL